MPSNPKTRKRIVSIDRDCSCTRGDKTPFNCWSCDAEKFEPSPSSAPAWDALPSDMSDAWLRQVSDDDAPNYVAQAEMRNSMGARVKVWHDDVRRPPDDSWIWCRSNQEVIRIAKAFRIDELSMGHDLGGSDIPLSDLDQMDTDFLQVDGDETGVDLADWLGSNDKIPSRVTIHTMNPDGGRNILGAFIRHNEAITNTPVISIEPFSR